MEYSFLHQICPLQEMDFTKQFTGIQYLALLNSEVEKIEKEALVHSPNLTWIHLGFNKIKSVEAETFHNNPKLEFTFLGSNIIKHIRASIFNNLPELK
jgi:Leucine-rich repeat (LRR) protein